MNDKAKKYFDSLKGKKVAFVGMGVANIPCAEFFAKLGIDVYACDKRDKDYIGKDICDKLEKLISQIQQLIILVYEFSTFLV